MINSIFDLRNYFFNVHSVAYFISGVLIAAESVFIFVQNRKFALNRSFALATIFAGAWLTGVGFIYSSLSEATALIWSKYYSWLGIIFIAPSVYLLSEVWKGRSLNKKFILVNFFIGLIFYLICIFSSYLVDGLWSYPWGFYPKAGKAEGAFIIWFCLLMILSFKNFVQIYIEEKSFNMKKQVKLVIIAFIFGFLGSSDFVANFGIPFYTFAAVIVLFFSTILAYTIVRYKFMDIETVIHKTLMWLVASSIIFIPIVLLSYVLNPWYKNANPFEVALLCACVFYFLVMYLKIFQPKIDHIFQRRKYDLEKIFEEFTLDLNRLKSPVEVIKKIQTTITGALYTRKILFFLYDEKTKKFLSNNLDDNEQAAILSNDGSFLTWLAKEDDIVYKDFVQVDPKYVTVKNSAMKYFNKMGAEVIVPLVLSNRLLGFMTLYKKSNLKRYSTYDIHFLFRIKNESTIAISNSILYGRVEEEVQFRTHQLLETQKQLIQAEKLATVGTLAGGVAHEINNPLTAVLTNVQMLLESKGIADESDKESLELIEEATKRCRTIVQKLMAYARKPLETVAITRLDLADVLKNVISFIGYQLEQENIRISTNIESSSYLIMGNQNELEQVFTNIILNARDAIKAAKKDGVVRISFSKSDDWMRIDIKDEGVGIPPELSSKIFDPFFTTKDVGKGTGLGLSICQAIIEKHNGLITFKTEINKGTTFTIQLPKAKPEEARV